MVKIAAFPIALLVGLYPLLAGAASCDGTASQAALAACDQQLQENPRDKTARMNSVKALVELQRYQEAIVSLESALRFGGDQALEQQLAAVRSLREEQIYTEKHQARMSAAASTGNAASNQLNKIRCTKLEGARALAACESWLEIGGPEEAEIQKRRGDLLLAAGNRDEAREAYRIAVNLDANLRRDASVASVLQPVKPVARTVVAAPTPKPRPAPPPVPTSITAEPSTRAVSRAVQAPAAPAASTVAEARSFSNAAVGVGVTF